QETGRAGRDGLPSECILLFRPSDVAKQRHFIDEKSEKEARIARAQLQQMVHYAETRECRRGVLLEYFGEKFLPQSCDSCDNRSRTIAAGAGRMCAGQVCDFVAYAWGYRDVEKADTDHFDQANRNRGESCATQTRRD